MDLKILVKSLHFTYKSSKKNFFALILIKILQGLFPLGTVIVVQRIVNEVGKYILHPDRGISMIIVLLGIQFSLNAMNSIVKKTELVLITDLEQKIELKIKHILAEWTTSVVYKFFDDHKFYNYLQRSQGNIGNRFLSPVNITLQIMSGIITVGSIIGFLFHFHWLLATICLSSAIPFLLVQSKFGRKKFHLIKFQTPTAREHNYIFSLLMDKDTNKEIRLFNSAKYLISKWRDLFTRNNVELLSHIKKHQTAQVLLDLATSSLYFASIGIVIKLLIQRAIKIGDFVAITSSITQTQNTINLIATNIARLYEKNLFLKDFYELLNYEKSIDRYGNEKFPELSEGIRIENLDFQYPGVPNLTLKNINLKIKANETIAIVGENGSGKSTLVNCLTGLYDPSDGRIFFDQKEIRTINRNSLFENFSVILQNFTKYYFTVKENITFKDEEDNLKMLEKVCNITGIHNDIEKLNKKYETRLGRIFIDSEELSGGQWQRLALARSIYKESKIFILDEPTSALDPITEANIFKLFKRITKNKTSIFISHRMYSARFADRIVVLKNGEIAEVGTHLELMDKKGEYYHLFTTQAHMYTENYLEEVN